MFFFPKKEVNLSLFYPGVRLNAQSFQGDERLLFWPLKKKSVLRAAFFSKIC
jgi:hypothetical protein